MRGTVAKRIGNRARLAAAKKPTEYSARLFNKWLGKPDSNGKPTKSLSSTIFCTGYRRVYQDMKKEYMANRGGGL